MADLKVYKVSALPQTYVASAIYLVPVSGSATLLDMYVASSDGLTVRNIISQTEITNLVSEALTNSGLGGSTSVVVADITDRDALAPTEVTIAVVLDATDDATVTSGSATYVYNPTNSTWVKISEAESMDVVLNWANIQNGPSSTAAQIDAAVADSHTHSNKAVLDKFGENLDGAPTYNGADLSMALAAEEW